MAPEEHIQKCSNSSGGGGGCDGGGDGGDGGFNGGGGGGFGRSSKRLKQKKQPQRGLGVAQLEKIRLEEQKKKDSSLDAIISPTNSSSCLALQSHNTFMPSGGSPSSISLPLTSPNDLPSSNSLFRSSPSLPNIDFLHSNQLPFSKPPLNVVGGGSGGGSGGGGDGGLSAMLGPGHGSWPKLWNGGFDLEGECQKLDHHGLSFRSNVQLGYDSNTPILPLPTLMHRSKQFQQPSSSSMVNVSSGLSASSSVSNLQMEPPSNQSYRGSNYTPLWLEDEKMVGLKRKCPFSEIPPAPPFHCKFPSSLVDPFARSDKLASCSTGSPAKNEPSNPFMREGPSSLTVLSEPKTRKVIRDNGSLDGDFLTLAPPTAHKHPSANSCPSSQELLITSQESGEDHMQRLGASGSSVQPFFSFLPSAKLQIGQPGNPSSNRDNKVRESIDLNLKL